MEGAAVPFNWEEQPGKPKVSKWSKQQRLLLKQRDDGVEISEPPGTGVGNGEFLRGASLEELLASDKSIHFLVPPPRLVRIQNMSDEASTSSASASSSSTSPVDDMSSTSTASHSRSKSVTLLDLISQQEKAPKTLEQLFKLDVGVGVGMGMGMGMDSPGKQGPSKGTPGRVQHKAPAMAINGTAGRRSSYLPYKKGLLSIFCMSPYDTGILPVVSPRLSSAQARPRHHFR